MDPAKIKLLIETGTVLFDAYDVLRDGACLFHSIAACSNFSARLHIPCPRIPQTVLQIRQAVCDFLRNNADNPILVGGTTPRDYVETMYGERAKNRLAVVDSDYSKNMVKLELDPIQYPQYVNTFLEWVEAMEKPHAFADEVMVEALAYCFDFCITVYTRSISMAVVPKKTGNETFDSLLDMGFSFENTRKALATTKGDHARALEILLSQPSQPLQPLPNLWRAQRYNLSGFPCNLLNDGDHYQFLYLRDFKPSVDGNDAVALAPLSSPHLLPPPAAAGGGSRVDSKRIQLPLPQSSPQSSPSPSRSPSSCPSPSPSQQLGCILTLPRGTLNRHDQKSFLVRVPEYALLRKVHLTGLFFVSELCLTLHDLQHVFQIFGSFPIGSERYRVIACMFDDGRCVQYAGSPKDLSRESEKKLFSSNVALVLSDPKRTLTSVLISRCD